MESTVEDMITQLQSTALSKLNDCSVLIKNGLGDLSSSLLSSIEKKTTELLHKVNVLEMENNNLKAMNDYLAKDKKRLEAQVLSLEDDIKSFTKVSKMIAIENENTKLKKEIEALKEQLKSVKTPVVEAVQSVESIGAVDTDGVVETEAVTETVTETETVTPQHTLAHSDEGGSSQEKDTDTHTSHKEEDICVKEKMIGKTIYYVDTSNKIYEKMEDGDVGEEKGRLVKVNGKTKVEWL